MPGPPSRLIAAVVRPLSDNAELEQSAIGFLENRITQDADPDAMIARWDEVDARKRKSIWPIGLWLLVAVVSAGIATANFHEFSRLIPWGKWLVTGSVFTPAPLEGVRHIASRLNESDRLLLVGDLSKPTKSERKAALWHSDPNNPAYFAEYAGAFVGDHEKLPPDFLKTARRIDPDNAWFTYLATAVEADDCVKSKSRKTKRVAGKLVEESPKSWEILDQPRLERAMELLREARSQSKCTDYSSELLRKRLRLLPQSNFIDQLDSTACLSEASVYANIRLRQLWTATAARACSLGESGNVLEFQEIANDADRFLRQMYGGETTTLLDELVARVAVSTLAESLGSGAEKLGLEDQAAYWKPIDIGMTEAQERLKSREFIVDGKAVEPGTITGGIIGGSVIEQTAKRTNTPLLLTDADLKPMRLFEHELFSKIFSCIAWIGLALCAGSAASYRFRVASMSRRLASRMEDQLRPSDWGWILVAGVVLPFVFVMVINRLTPLGGRAFGVHGMGLLLPAGHFLGLLLLWLALPAQVVRWRLAKRVGGFGFPGPSLIGWLTTLSATAFVPMIGWVAVSQVGDSRLSADTFSEWPWQAWAAVGLGGIALLGVIVSIGIAMLGRADHHFYQATSALIMVKVFAVAMLVIALASVGFKASERYWFKQDWMTKFDIAGPGWSAFESQVAAQLRKELRQTLGYEP